MTHSRVKLSADSFSNYYFIVITLHQMWITILNCNDQFSLNDNVYEPSLFLLAIIHTSKTGSWPWAWPLSAFMYMPNPAPGQISDNPISVVLLSSNYILLGKVSQLNKWLYFDIHNYTHSHKVLFQVKCAFYYMLIICDEIMHSVGLDWVRVHLIKLEEQ